MCSTAGELNITIRQLRAENEALHTKLAQFTKWNSQLTAKCNWYNCDGARLERENEALKQQVEQGKQDAVPEDIRKDAESWRAYKARKDEVIAAGMGRKILRDAAAPKQEK